MVIEIAAIFPIFQFYFPIAMSMYWKRNVVEGPITHPVNVTIPNIPNYTPDISPTLLVILDDVVVRSSFPISSCPNRIKYGE